MPGLDETRGLDDHEEVLEVVLLDDLEQRCFQPVIRQRDTRLVDLARLGVAAGELADD